MCGVCGIVSENFKPESRYWGKMCEYITKSKSISTGGCFASSSSGYFYKEIVGCGCFAIVEGTIHNYKAIKHNLYLKGVVVETDNVAELVLLCYMYLGQRCFKIFKGEFCVVIWNGCDKELILFRDKVGLNTIFYYVDGVRLVFSTKIKGILKFPFVKAELCEDLYCKLFTLSGGSNQGETLFSKIYEVPAGSYVRYKDLKTEVKSYHTFTISDVTDSFPQTVSAFKYLSKSNADTVLMTEKTMSKNQLKENIESFVERCDFPSPYIDLKTLSNLGSEECFTDLTGIFNMPERFKLPTSFCKKQDREFVNGFLSTLPWFEHKGEKDISKKEEIYIKQYLVLPQVVYARKNACKNIKFPYVTEEITELSLNSLKHLKKLSKEFSETPYRRNKENIKNLKALFSEMTECENLMCGLIEKEEILKFTRLFPRPETMLYLMQVNIWINRYL